MCLYNKDTIIAGENEGWIDLIRVTDDIRTVDMVLNKRFDRLGHIYQIQTTS